MLYPWASAWQIFIAAVHFGLHEPSLAHISMAMQIIIITLGTCCVALVCTTPRLIFIHDLLLALR